MRILRDWGPASVIAGLAVMVHIGWARELEVRARPERAVMLEAFELVSDHYVEPVDEAWLGWAAARGMAESLDPYSRFFDPEEAEEFREGTSGSFGGLGIFIEIRDGLIEVISPIAGTPAAEAGIRPGDLILAINGQRHEFRDTADAMKVLKGEPGSEITLTVKRRSQERSFDVSMKRAEITIDSVRAVEVLPGGIGYLLVIAFQEQTDADLAAALETLERDGARALILDLRGNPGGLLTSATSIADIFLDPGLVLVGTKARDGFREQVLSESKAKYKDWPIAVLIDAGSASASEILGGALRDHQRAILVGERSYGKGSVQSIFDMLDGETVMKFTTAYYTTPSGRKIHRNEDAGPEEEWGLIPDIVAPASESEQVAIARWSSDRYVAELKRAAGESMELPPRPKDRALEAAVERLTAVRLGTAKLFEGAEASAVKSSEQK